MRKKTEPDYNPCPIDTSGVEISQEMQDLMELLAKNTHDVWAKGRISEGWRYGEKRNDKKKTTPCLVEYDELPDSEKEYDRNTAAETIKCILKLGYKIEKNNK